MKISVDILSQALERYLQNLGVPEADAATVTGILVQAELEGIKSHGVSRLPIYVRQLEAGGLNPQPRIEVTALRPGVVQIDGDHALGPVAAMRAVLELSPVIRQTGVGVALVRDAGHVGPLSAYVGAMAKEGFVALAFVNTPAAIAPWGGRTPVLGTNPIAFAAPTRGEPLVVDLSLSKAARGKILNAARENRPIPEGWAVDSEGKATTDAAAALRGALLPSGDAKGYALALVVEVLAGILAGSVLSQDLKLPWEHPETLAMPGLLLIGIDGGVRDANAMDAGLDRLATAVHEAGSRLPGERRSRAKQRSLHEGVEIPDTIWAQIREDEEGAS